MSGIEQVYNKAKGNFDRRKRPWCTDRRCVEAYKTGKNVLSGAAQGAAISAATAVCPPFGAVLAAAAVANHHRRGSRQDQRMNALERGSERARFGWRCYVSRAFQAVWSETSQTQSNQ